MGKNLIKSITHKTSFINRENAKIAFPVFYLQSTDNAK